MQANAKMSFLKIRGSSLMSISRIIPPKAPVIVPITIATQNGYPTANDFWIPTTTNRASPIESKTKNVFSRRLKIFRKRWRRQEQYLLLSDKYCSASRKGEGLIINHVKFRLRSLSLILRHRLRTNQTVLRKLNVCRLLQKPMFQWFR